MNHIIDRHGFIHKLAPHITPDGRRQVPVGTLAEELRRAANGIELLPYDTRPTEKLAVTLLANRREMGIIISQCIAAAAAEPGYSEPEPPLSQGGGI